MRAPTFVLVTSLVLIGCVQNVTSQNITNAKELITYLFTTSDYNYRVRPVVDQTQAINVYVSFYLLNLNGLDEVTETLKTTGYLYIYWADDQLDWDPAQFGNITGSFWPQDEIWKPDITLKNSYTQYKPLGDKSLNVHVGSGGGITWQPFQVFESTCSVQITYFPFDVQTCELEFVAWSYSKQEVYMMGDSARGIDLSGYEGNPSWRIVNTGWSADYMKTESSITFTIRLQRKPLYVILSIVFPLLMLSILNNFTFVLPCDGGEKASYSVTIFLAFAVFLTIVETALPANSDTTASFSVYLIMMTIISTITTVVALIECRCSGWDETVTPIPKWVVLISKLGRCVPCRMACKDKKSNIRRVQPSASPHRLEKPPVSPQSNGGVLVDTDEDADDDENHTWKHVINGVDAFCFVTFGISAILVNFLCLLIPALTANAQANTALV